jgi:hypothetical protein
VGGPPPPCCFASEVIDSWSLPFSFYRQGSACSSRGCRLHRGVPWGMGGEQARQGAGSQQLQFDAHVTPVATRKLAASFPPWGIATREVQQRISLLGSLLVVYQRSLVLLGVLMCQEHEVRGPNCSANPATGHPKSKGRLKPEVIWGHQPIQNCFFCSSASFLSLV